MKQVPVEDAVSSLQLLMNKYEWIRNPVPTEMMEQTFGGQGAVKRPKYDVTPYEPPQDPQPAKAQPKESGDITKSQLTTSGLQPTGNYRAAPPAEMPLSVISGSTAGMGAIDPNTGQPMAGSAQLFTCPFGCGRRFGAEPLERHKRSCPNNPDRPKKPEAPK